MYDVRYVYGQMFYIILTKSNLVHFLKDLGRQKIYIYVCRCKENMYSFQIYEYRHMCSMFFIKSCLCAVFFNQITPITLNKSQTNISPILYLLALFTRQSLENWLIHCCWYLQHIYIVHTNDKCIYIIHIQYILCNMYYIICSMFM